MSDVDDQSYLVHLDPPTPKNQDKVQSVFTQVASYGLGGLFFAAHGAVNAGLLSWLDPEDGAGAASLVSSTQAVGFALPVGMLLSAGLLMGREFGQGNYSNVGDLASLGGTEAIAMGAILAGLFCGLADLYGHHFDGKEGELAHDFLYGNALSAIPLLYLVITPQLMFMHGDVWSPAISMFEVFTASGLASYLLAFPGKMGAFGVGVGGVIGASVSALSLRLWTAREEYLPYQMHQCCINNLGSWLSEQSAMGFPLMLERANEWLSVFLLTVIVSQYSGDQLAALNPSLSYLMLFGVMQQGIAQGAGTMLSNVQGGLIASKQDEDEREASIAHRKTMQLTIGSNAIGLGLSMAAFAVLSLGRSVFVKPFLGEDIESDVRNLSKDVLMLTFAGVVFDSFRIIGSGALRGWQDILWPTAVSSVCLVVGTLAGWGLNEAVGGTLVESMVGLRAAGIALSGAAIAKRQYDFVMKDRTSIEERFPSLVNTWPSFFRAAVTEAGLQLNQSVKADSDGSFDYGKS